jgi:ubiquinone/menaquinone biosynthesis C-methylase UbiE
MAKLGKYKITGLDISKDFVEIARRNVKETGVEVEFRQGSVADIPFQDKMFDFIICNAAFKNFTMYYVLWICFHGCAMRERDVLIDTERTR